MLYLYNKNENFVKNKMPNQPNLRSLANSLMVLNGLHTHHKDMKSILSEMNRSMQNNNLQLHSSPIDRSVYQPKKHADKQNPIKANNTGKDEANRFTLRHGFIINFANRQIREKILNKLITNTNQAEPPVQKQMPVNTEIQNTKILNAKKEFEKASTKPVKEALQEESVNYNIQNPVINKESKETPKKNVLSASKGLSEKDRQQSSEISIEYKTDIHKKETATQFELPKQPQEKIIPPDSVNFAFDPRIAERQVAEFLSGQKFSKESSKKESEDDGDTEYSIGKVGDDERKKVKKIRKIKREGKQLSDEIEENSESGLFKRYKQPSTLIISGIITVIVLIVIIAGYIF